MKLRQFTTLNDLISNVHEQGVGVIEYADNKVPCIYVQQDLYDIIMEKCIGKKYVVDVLLNIFYDGHYVFVDIQLEFIDLGIEENFLIPGNTSMNFFDALNESGLLGIIPKSNGHISSSNIFLIQLPKKERISTAVDLIKSNLKQSNMKYEKTI
ncbi:MAG TPA: hypothetical protein VFU79_08850 [Nitrososphaeraceae archaeon]|nr:hypothetical protein [Nitrososphaeraceae archaeon]